ncbi:RNA polymerase sigma factor [Dactylosporangium sp. CA-092794]|uniref:RNA polymerase sigma factor n=1 Tax=Dactylosporangium sp. CA-092794 TaxID=3239929 RepID=UPI003D90E38D
MITSTNPLRQPDTEANREVLAALHAGDRAAFGELYQQTAAVLARYVAARLRDRDAVDDVVQEAFCMALAEPHLLGEDLLGSMLRLAARAVTRHGWSQRRYVRAAYTVYEDRTSDPQSAAVTLAVLRRPGLRQALARLTTLQRQVVQLRYLDGYPRDRTAAAMGRRIPAVRWLERAALRRLHTECSTGSA